MKFCLLKLPAERFSPLKIAQPIKRKGTANNSWPIYLYKSGRPTIIWQTQQQTKLEGAEGGGVETEVGRWAGT